MNALGSSRDLKSGVRFMLTHTLITVLAIATAFALPHLANYILFYWWPQVKADTHLLLTTEILFAALLALLLNLVATSWDNRRLVDAAKLASLVHARRGKGRLAALRERMFGAGDTTSRDVFVMAVTGAGTFGDERSRVRAALDSAYEVRVMLAEPQEAIAAGEVRHDESRSVLHELRASIELLAGLRRAGRKVSLKLYAGAPIWRLVILSDQVWVQYSQDGREPIAAPEYIFALNPRNPRHGLFAPFYVHFLDRWSDASHPEYDFDRGELVYRDAFGNEVRRAPAPVRQRAHTRPASAPGDVSVASP